MIRVLLVDDHQLVRHGLQQILTDTNDIKVAGQAGSGEEAVQLIRQQPFDVVVLDIGLPGMDGPEVLQAVKAEHPKLAVLILTMYPEEQYAVRLLRMGAAGYLTKDSAADELIIAIRKVAAGGKYVTPSLAEKIVFSFESDSNNLLHDSLSKREFQILRLLATGQSVSEIATGLTLSVKTISTYRTRILEKMNLRNTAEIIRYAIRHGLVIN